jgi:N-acetylglutamate synthase-like GNAT family acetyltransferase
MFKVQIKEYQSQYQNQVIELVLGIQQNEFKVPITLDDQPDLLRVNEFYQQGNGNFWVALLDEKVVGTIALIDIGNRQATLRKMFVKPDFRGKALGTALLLLQTLLAWSRSKGIEEIYLGTMDRLQAAQQFYLKNGFIEILSDELPARFPRMAVDTRFFKKTLF